MEKAHEREFIALQVREMEAWHLLITLFSDYYCAVQFLLTVFLMIQFLLLLADLGWDI